MNGILARMVRKREPRIGVGKMNVTVRPRKTGIVPGNAQDIGMRDEQQDAFGFSDLGDWGLVRESGGLAVVADGIGGLQLGGQASALAVRAMLDAYAGKTPEETVPQALLRALRRANDEVLALAERAGLDRGEVGTTLAAAVIHDGRLHWVSVGDSRIYLFRGGQVDRLTRDHRYLNRLLLEVERGTISREEALQNEDRLALTSFLGLPELVEIDCGEGPLDLLPGDRVLLCTDGVYEVLGEGEMLELMEGHPQEAAEGLLLRVRSKRAPHQDNMTAVVMFYESDTCEGLDDFRVREDTP